jgi:hypothetical protein
MTALRQIEPMTFHDIEHGKPGDRRPELRWVSPRRLYVDETYQRDLSKRSVSVIKRAVAGFSWNRYKPPIVTEDGKEKKLHVIDGQHTAIAAATIGLSAIPVFVVHADAVDERARSFVAHNTDRVSVTPITMFRALVAAGDPDACDVANVCKRAGVRIREYSQSSTIAEGDTKAIGLIRKVIARRGVQKARMALQCLVKAKLAPLDAAAIRAAEEIICVARPGIDLDVLTAAIRIEGVAGIAKAGAKAKVNHLPIWREVMARWLARVDGG